ncbi:MAG: cupin domain-containing protein [Rhodothermales bacterium]|nr:cupin domain-containing protein [Rhodothermales bacterium]
MDTTVKKVDASHSPTGEMGQSYLVSGTRVALRLWEEEPNDGLDMHARPYETVGYCIEGQAELHLGSQKLTLGPGDSWLVPENAEHKYVVTEPFKAVEATSPPARVNDRDDA